MIFMRSRLTHVGFVLACLLALAISGCGFFEEDPVNFLAGSPAPGSTIKPNTNLTFTFDGTPEDVKINGETARVSGNIVTVDGPFTPGDLQLRITWKEGSAVVTYTVDGAIFDSADPPVGSTIDAYTDIIVTFKGNPEGLWIIPDVDRELSGSNLTIKGGFEPGPLSLSLVWDDDSEEINYTVSNKRIVKIENIWVDHNIVESSENGMWIHVKFKLANMQGRGGLVVAYFFFQDERPLKDFNENFHTSEGNVAASEEFITYSVLAVAEDFKIFMPYSELHLGGQGEFKLKFHVRIYDSGAQSFVDDPRYDDVLFTITR